jgi:hypothetical protein
MSISRLLSVGFALLSTLLVMGSLGFYLGQHSPLVALLLLTGVVRVFLHVLREEPA